jgi:hypothetical protein
MCKPQILLPKFVRLYLGRTGRPGAGTSAMEDSADKAVSPDRLQGSPSLLSTGYQRPLQRKLGQAADKSAWGCKFFASSLTAA